MAEFASRTLPRAAALAGSGSLILPAAAFAHGLAGGYDPNRPIPEYLWLGFWHMIAGWDHLLFIAGVILLAGNPRSAAKLISLFVAGHSLTLLLATLAGWGLDPTLVDAVIALSLLYVGIQGYRGRPQHLRLTGAVVFAFGLVHGLGLSSRLQDLGLPADGVLERVLLFNVGVEIGQLVALGIMVGVGTLVARRLPKPAEAQRAAFAMLALAGLVAAGVISFSSAESGQSTKSVARGAFCTERRSEPPRSIGGAHPAKRFYGPGESVPAQDLSHVIGDGLVVVRYRPDLPRRALDRLRRFASEDSQYVIAAANPDQTRPVRALAAERTLTCSTTDIAGLTSFRDTWLASLRP